MDDRRLPTIEYGYKGEMIMRMCAFLATLFAILVGIATLPAAACELEQAIASHPTVIAFLAEHGRAANSTPLPPLVACKADGSGSAADAECCKPIGEGRACVSK
jgi:hypothetical protein